MKLKSLTAVAGILCLLSAPAAAEDMGLRFARSHGEVRCGSDLSTKVFAYKDNGGDWRGFDADMCRALSWAIFGKGDRFKIVDVQANEINKALAAHKIDIMFGNAPLSAENEIKGQAAAAELLYYDKQMFLARTKEGATSMEDYRGSNVCVLSDSEDYYKLLEYNRKYALELNPVPFKSLNLAKQAFYLKRCPLFTASELYLKGTAASVVAKNPDIEMLPEVLSYRPVYAYTEKSNKTFGLVSKWVINALKLAEQNDISSLNTEAVIGITDTSTRNLLGLDKRLWTSLQLQPEWAKQAIKEIGNYGEIFENNFGKNSSYKIDRDKNNLLDNGGAIIPQPFI